MYYFIGNDICKVDDKIWFSNREANGLFCLDICTDNLRFVTLFPNELLWQERLHGSVQYYKGKIIFVPSCAENVAVYDIVSNHVHVYPLNNNGKEELRLRENVKFSYSVLYHHYVYMFGICLPYIYRFDINTGNGKFIEGWYELFKKNGFHDGYEIFEKGNDQIGRYVYLCSRQNNGILQFDLETESFVSYAVGEDTDCYLSITNIGDDYWLMSSYGKLICWNIKKGICKKIPVKLEESYYRRVKRGNIISFFPGFTGKKAIHIDTVTGTVNQEYMHCPVVCAKKIDDKFLIVKSDGNILIQSLDGEEIELRNKFGLLQMGNYLEKLNLIDRTKLLNECRLINLQNLEVIIEIYKYKKPEEEIGPKIYNNIMLS